MEQKAVTEITSIAHYLPEQRVSSQALMEAFDSERRFGIPSRDLSVLMGIEERRWANSEAKPSSLAIAAAQQAIAKAGVDPAHINCVLYCGIERDWQEPATAHKIQHAVGAHRATCFDITNACHGFMNGLAVADAFVANGSADLCLICTGEVGSHATRSILRQLQDPHYSKANLKLVIGALTMGDAGAAMLIQRASNGSGFQQFNFQSAGEFAELCYYNKNEIGEIEGEMHMETICDETLAFHERCIADTYRVLQWHPQDVDTLICHQVGVRPHHKVCRLANVDRYKAPTTLNHLGNICSATIPVVMSLNPPEKDDKVLILSSGSGMTIGQSALIM